MSVAKIVQSVEPVNLDWLEILDEDGGLWRYEKRGNAPAGLAMHVEGQWLGGTQKRAALVRDEKGQAVLRQDEPGLPKKIGVYFVQPAGPPGAPVGVLASWGGLLEYEQV